MRFSIVFTTLLATTVRSTILMFGLFYAPAVYPVLAALFDIGWLASFGLRLGIEFDPMMILLGGIINIADMEITWAKNTWSFIVLALNFGLAFAGSALGGLLFIALNNGAALPVSMIPQQLIPGGWWINFFNVIVFAFAASVIFVMTNVYSRDGYGAIPARFFGRLAIGWIFFFIARDVVDYGLSFTAYVAANNFGTVNNGTTLFFGWIIALGLVIGGYYLFWRPVTRRIVKRADSRGDPVVLNHLHGLGDLRADCELPSDYVQWKKSRGDMDEVESAYPMSTKVGKSGMRALD